jgi:hypothetical protein
MATVLRPAFGQPCFECGHNVPATRVRVLRERVEQQTGRRWRKDDLLCVDCQKRRDALSFGVEMKPYHR